MKRLIFLLAFVFVFLQIYSQDKGFRIGNGLNVVIPTKDFSKDYGPGLGVNLVFEYKFSSWFGLSGDGGWSFFRGKQQETIAGDVKIPDINTWYISGGVKFAAKYYYADIKAGYFVDDIHEWGLIPSIGGQYEKFDLSVGYKFYGDNQWVVVRFAYFWAQQYDTW